MAHQLLPVVPVQAKQDSPVAAAKSGSSAGSGGITNQFLVLLLQMIPGGKTVAAQSRVVVVPSANPTSSGDGATGTRGKNGTSEEPAARSKAKAQAADGSDTATLQGMMAMRQPLVAMQMPVAPREAASEMKGKAGGKIMIAPPVPATKATGEMVIGSPVSAAKADGEMAIASPVLAAKAGGEMVIASSVLARKEGQETATAFPVQTAKTGGMELRLAELHAEISSPAPVVQETPAPAFVDVRKDLKPVGEQAKATPGQSVDPAREKSKEPSPLVPQPVAREAQVQDLSRKAETGSAEEALILNAVKGLVEKPPARVPHVASLPVRLTEGSQAAPLKDGAREIAKGTAGTQANVRKTSPAQVDSTRSEARDGESDSAKDAGEVRVRESPVPLASGAAPIGRTEAAVGAPVVPSRRQAGPTVKEVSDQRAQPETRAEKTILPRGASVEQSTSGQHMNDTTSGRTFNAVLQQTAGDQATPIQHAGASSTDATRVLTPATSQGVMDQVVTHISLQVEGKTSEMRMTLKPESLGEVVVQVRMDDGKMHAQIDVSQSSVKTALEANLPQLRQALVERGIDVQRIDIFAATQSSTQESHGGQGDGSRRQGGNRRQTDVDPVESYEASRQLGYNTMEIIM